MSRILANIADKLCTEAIVIDISVCMKYIILFLTSLLFCVSCHIISTGEYTGSTLNVDLNTSQNGNVKLEDLFSKVEIIPLVTTDSCLIIHIDKVIPHRNHLFIFDSFRAALYVFDEEGSFLKQIARKGEGPGDYQAIADVFAGEDTIGLLSPFGTIQLYNNDGQFIGRNILPAKPNYYAMSRLREGNWVCWSCVEKEENGISVIGKDSMKLIYGTWHQDRMLDMGLMKPFYVYNENVYFGSAYHNEVYRIASDSLKMEYRWDFGSGNIDKQKLLSYSQIENSSQRNDKILRDLESGVLPYSMESHNQNSRYYYVALRKGIGRSRPWINVFYHKADGKTYVFEKTKEGIGIRPVSFTDEYIISLLPFDNVEIYKKILSDEEFTNLSLRKSDDNPCLVKFYFK